MLYLTKVKEKGSALFLILAILGVVSALTGSVAIGLISNLRMSSAESADDQSRFIAQAGIQSALSRLAQPLRGRLSLYS